MQFAKRRRWFATLGQFLKLRKQIGRAAVGLAVEGSGGEAVEGSGSEEDL